MFVGEANMAVELAPSKGEGVGAALLLWAEPKLGVGAPKLKPAGEEDCCELKPENGEGWLPNAKPGFAGPLVAGAEEPKVNTLLEDDD